MNIKTHLKRVGTTTSVLIVGKQVTPGRYEYTCSWQISDARSLRVYS